MRNFKDQNVHADFVSTTNEAASGVAPITVDEDGNCTIIVVPGANLLLDENDLESAKHVIVSSKVLLCQNEISPKTTLAAMKMSKVISIIEGSLYSL